MKSKTGKNRGQRALALLLTLIMCVSLLGNTALAAPMGQTPSNNQQQIVDGWLAADDHGNLGDVITNGEWRATDGDRVRVSKTIAPTSKENDFEVTLTVETKENLQETISGPDAAVTLVIDVSASMSQCAICGGDYHESHVFQDDGPQSDDTYKTYIEATKSDYPEYSAAYDLMYEMYGGKEQDGKCDFPLNVSYSVGKDTWYTYCNQTEEDHVTHEFKERLQAAKDSAIGFIDDLKASVMENGTPFASRWVSLVSFSDNAEMKCSWVDITTADGYNTIVTAINGLVPNLGAQPKSYEEGEKPGKVDPSKGYDWGTEEGGTNICAGLQQAAGLMASPDIQTISKGNKFAILLSDGMPSYYLDDSGNREGRGYEEDTNKMYCDQTVEYATRLKNASSLYSVCFCAARDVCYTDGGEFTVINLLDEMSDKCYSADNPDELREVYGKLGDVIRESLRLFAEAWTVTDPMGDLIVYNGLVEENQNVDYGNNGISWDLRGDEPIRARTEGTETVYTYQLKYNITLDNLKEWFSKEQHYATNGYTGLTYVFLEDLFKNGDWQAGVQSDTYRIGFNVPQVKGYLGDLTFTKTSPEGDPLSGAKFTLTLINEDEEWSRTATSDDNGEVSFERIPSGHTYTLTETKAPEGYGKVAPMTVTVSYGNVTVKNSDGEVILTGGTGTIIDPSITSNLTVKKVWKSSDGSIIDAPKGVSVTVHLLKDGVVEDTVILNESNGWTYTWKKVLGSANWTVEEEPIAGYTATVEGPTSSATFDKTTGMMTTGNGWTYTITNVQNPTTVTVNKKWVNVDGTTAAPEDAEVTVYLLQDGKEYGDPVVLNAENGWTHTFENLVKVCPDGKDYKYTVKEAAYAGYTATIEGPTVNASFDRVTGMMTPGNGWTYTITNTQQATSVTVDKQWVNADGTTAAPENAEVTVHLLQDGNNYGDPVVLNAENGWTHTFENLVKVGPDGKDYKYTVKEDAYTGYTATIEGPTVNASFDRVTGMMTPGNGWTYTITNTQDTGSLTITKAISGGGTEAAGKTFTFTVTGPDNYQETVTISGAGTATLNNLVPGQYTVAEDSADADITGYTLTISGEDTVTVEAGQTGAITITNTYTAPEQQPSDAPSEDPDPDTPTQPNDPNTPDTPDNPTTPDTPNNPNPDQQDFPEQNNNPNTPDNQNNPEPNPIENNPNQDLPNQNDVPQAANPNTQNQPNVAENNPSQDFADEGTPLAPAAPVTPNNPNAPEGEEGIDLGDDDVPLSDLPPVTGETVMTIIWIGLLVASGVGMLVTMLAKKRTRI